VPIYEYKCDNCHHQLELLQKFNDDPLRTCPSCGQDSVRKLVSAAAFHLKGTGWYATDFKDKPKGKNDSNKVNNPKKSDGSKNTGSTATEPKSSGNKSPDEKSNDSSSKSTTAKSD
jgi:putative FmdB family regulatory protein